MSADIPSVARLRETYPDAASCPVRNVLDQLASKWSVLILTALAQRPYRFGELKREIGDISQSGRIALVLGTEGEGLPEQVLRQFRTARIAQSPGLDSLNVATASGIALYSLARRNGFLDI